MKRIYLKNQFVALLTFGIIAKVPIAEHFNYNALVHQQFNFNFFLYSSYLYSFILFSILGSVEPLLIRNRFTGNTRDARSLTSLPNP